MLTAAYLAAAAAAALHVFIFYLESFAWTTRARKVFGTTEQEAANTKEMAFNQGFYNLFLAIIAAVGIALHNHALIYAGTGSMLAAALVLALTSPDKRGAAAKQGVFPLLSVLLLALS
ncbi:DUF1304 domain-containing protein [Corynebacterium sp. 153RC1]|uniref:DUF1304 domain-containing protein n=1 Tax=Corynebacterium TaxID=1716 RepID=UPI00211CC7EE|nr:MULTISPECIES: DUF1304 domain-containing protein [unclassified Corynebacterium]MCQ9343512.1 DUF1304 domain-containing protein [Corynebacterium sp. 76QC2CO]MCQ9352826.1 DUF1304 domain-containing protein [Corynebacterium sp. 209RC1]MCQ9355218.1 DUF1304 domain-containing protein [Corynebacterium sp. 1222RC1]MCQ9357405.1 DUF1304 domain-containing protein [Corynebacterium sp. 122RC1]MCQ9359667.1 DUF1304 domain-containing protein [Corynebacterium sp. 142RC1]